MQTRPNNLTNSEQEQANHWSVYLIQASDSSLYCGITTDIDRRFRQHQTGKGAKYFRGRRAEKVVFHGSGFAHKAAAQLEYKIKRLTRKQKLDLIAGRIKLVELTD